MAADCEDTSITLPVFTGMTEADLGKVEEALREGLEEAGVGEMI